jgi:outer membrane protein assembly factor BamB
MKGKCYCASRTGIVILRIAVLTVAILGFQAEVCPAQNWWPMFHHDTCHLGYSTSTAPATNAVCWTYTTGGAVSSCPAVVDNLVYVGSDDGRIYCLNVFTADTVWTFQTGNAVGSSPAVAGGRVYIGHNFTKIYCLDAINGDSLWCYQTGDWVVSSPAVVDGRVYVGSMDGNVYCLNASTGDFIWSYPTGGYVWSSPAVVEGNVYVGSCNNSVYCLNASTGGYVWSYPTGDWVASSPAVDEGRVYVGSDDNNVYCLDASGGGHIWTFPTGGDVRSSPAIAYGNVYVGSYDGRLYCLDTANGDSLWSYDAEFEIHSSPAVADGKVYVGTKDMRVLCISAYSSVLTWQYTTGGDVNSSPAVADERVFVGSNDGNVYVFGPSAVLYDVAVTEVSLSDSVMGQGDSVDIYVTVENQGSATESFDVTMYYGSAGYSDDFESGQKPEWTYHADNPNQTAVVEISSDIYMESPTHSLFASNLYGGSSGSNNGVADARLDISGLGLTIPYTIEFWFYPSQSSYSSYNHFVVLGANKDLTMMLYNDDDGIHISDGDGWRWFYYDLDFQAWHKIKYIRDDADGYMLLIDSDTITDTGNPNGDLIDDVSTTMTFGDYRADFGKGEGYWDDIIITTSGYGEIETQNVADLPAGLDEALTCEWEPLGVPPGDYTMSAFAHYLALEIDSSDNRYFDGILRIMPYICGDADNSGGLNLLDATFIINYLYKNGPEPDYMGAADADGSGGVNLLDATCIINYLYKNGSKPECV